MRQSYLLTIALPEDIAFDAIPRPDATVVQATVDAYVNALAKPTWYTDPGQLRTRRDTRMWMLHNRGFRTVTDPYTNREMRIFLCETCRNGVSESGVELGHIVAWRQHLKQAGVESAQEARAAYNNLANLRLECRACNASHDWE